jgi:acyl CoA:acetate/3-ketoacid CoA transferase alpha subunit
MYSCMASLKYTVGYDNSSSLLKGNYIQVTLTAEPRRRRKMIDEILLVGVGDLNQVDESSGAAGLGLGRLAITTNNRKSGRKNANSMKLTLQR